MRNMTPESHNIASQLSLTESSNATSTYLIFAFPSLQATEARRSMPRPTATLLITTPLQE
ncbi:hypothetical protein BJY00DRAFT_101059 [Aspergillus carlsbadensis]|nr:hypothetical protein BJY00DRAFT_101059 [Aspergillus carlsbadensis]